VLVAALWWNISIAEDRRAADKLVAAEPEERSRWASSATVRAPRADRGDHPDRAGIRQLLERPSRDAVARGRHGGFHAGDVFFRWVMGMRPLAVRSLGAKLSQR